MARPAHSRPKARQDRAVVRVTKCWRVHPSTAEAIADESRRSGLSQGQVVDRLQLSAFALVRRMAQVGRV